MRLTVNGKDVEAEAGITVAGLLDHLAVGGERRVAVAVNGALAPRDAHAATRLREGDRVEVIQAVAGG